MQMCRLVEPKVMLIQSGGSIQGLQGEVVALQASILDQAWEGTIALPSREEVANIPMPELPNLDPPSPRTQFDTIAQYLQVCFTGRRPSLLCLQDN